MKAPIYLDHAAATPIDPLVRAAMLPYMTDHFYNPSALYGVARQVRKDIDEARLRVAFWLGARPAEIIFTSGGTESDNLAVRGIMDQFPEGNIVVSAVEHDAVLAPARCYDYRIAPVQPDGIVDLAALASLIDEKTVLISVMYANNELGTIQPIRALTQLVAQQRADRRRRGNDRPLYVHTDACQATPYLDLHTARLGIDMMTINASKMYGPKQVGALYVRARVTIVPQMLGGGQERNLRSGTENTAGIIGLAAALELVQTRRHEEVKRLGTLQHTFFEEIKVRLPHAVINGSQKHRLPNNVHVTLPGSDNERLMIQLDQLGVLVAAGSACSASNQEPSHVLRAVGLSDRDARSSLRITMGHNTDENSVRIAAELLQQCVL